MYVDYSGHMPTWLTYTLGALAFVVAGVLVAATMGIMAPGVICAASFTLSFLGISLSTATTIATVGTMIVMTAAAAYAGDVAFTQVTGESILLNTVFMGNETAYGIGAFATTIASQGFLYMFFESLQMGICFIAGTLVETENGGIPIEEITAGMMVYAHNPDTGETELKEVVRVFRNEASELVHVYVNGEEIVCTNEHPFYSPVKGWTAACQLRAGDVLVTVNGEYVIVEQVQHELLESPVTVYNFEVEDFHTYFVSDSAILVHNKCVVNQNGVKVEVRTREDPRHIPHAHVSGNGPNTTIGLDMQPMKNHPALSSKQYSVVEKNWEAIKDAIIQIFGK